ncbi:Ig-like domain repeat protein [Nakamurella deserti]|uniref:Ig-like domain repeat protein n=1 Tax=Nakamurella deserti TaxID=2164074 RepID=UPI001479623F|nr:Ig-like domain repeat protein [Nakamurella deserti]
MRTARTLIAAAAVALLVVGCGPAGSESTPTTAGPTTAAVQDTTLEVHAADTSVAYGSGVEVTFALAAAGGPVPATATAAVSIGSTVVERRVPVGADGAGSVVLDAADLTPGTHVVSVAYAGDPAFAAAAARTTLTVQPATSSIELALTPLGSGATTAAATVGTATGVPAEGTVAFTIDGARVGETTVTDGVAAMEVAPGLGIGTHQMDAVFTPAVPGRLIAAGTSAVLTVSRTTTSVMATGSSEAVRYGDSSVVTVAVTPTGPPADLTGAVTVVVGGTTVAEGTTDAAGTAALEFTTTVDPGTQSYTVSYAGNDRVEPAQTEMALTTTRTSVDIGIDTPNLKSGESGTVRISVIGSPQNPTGTATVTYDGAVVAEGTLDADGDLSARLGPVTPGTHTIAVTYGGDVRFDGAQASETLKVKEPVVNPNADGAAAINASNPCPAKAAACVDLANEKAWLQSGGQVTYGPVSITSGRAGYRTPAGTYSAYWFHKDHKSSIYDDAPMPNSVFFNGDIAFHQGSLSQQSHGCIHLGANASATFFDTLSVGDTVYVWGSAPY